MSLVNNSYGKFKTLLPSQIYAWYCFIFLGKILLSVGFVILKTGLLSLYPVIIKKLYVNNWKGNKEMTNLLNDARPWFLFSSLSKSSESADGLWFPTTVLLAPDFHV